MQKTIIAPLIALLMLLLQSVFHVNIPDGLAEQLTFAIGELVAGGIVLYGIFKSHKKKPEEPVE